MVKTRSASAAQTAAKGDKKTIAAVAAKSAPAVSGMKKKAVGSTAASDAAAGAVSTLSSCSSSSSSGGPLSSMKAASPKAAAAAANSKKNAKGAAAMKATTAAAGGGGAALRALTEAKPISCAKAAASGREGPEYCAVCFGDFADEAKGGGQGAGPVIQLKCGCVYHENCLLPLFDETNRQYLLCPICRATFGVRRGDMPDGQMTVVAHSRQGLTCGGHPTVGTLEIRYDFPHIGKGHNGRRFTAYNFPRAAFVPHTAEGEKLVRMLKLAFERRLTFTVRDSMTTGDKNAVCWNEIHHRTSFMAGSLFGWPDPTYFSRVSEELALKGITERDVKDDKSPIAGMVRPK